MRALLFVQTGDGPWKCISRSVGFDPACRCQGQAWLADSGYYVWWMAHATALAADRWKLVECENAEDGREAIASGRAELRSGFGGNGSLLIGRILASGGRRA